MKIGIVGGGLMGLALAHRLTRHHHQVSVIERDRQLGGLATFHDYGKFYWDRFYHVILPTDRQLISFLNDIGLSSKLRWARTYTGFFVDRKLFSLSSGVEFLRFSPLNFFSKCRFVATILYCAKIKDWRALEQIKVGDWLRKIGGKSTYEKIWKPLLLAKLGKEYERVSAVFIWSYIVRMFSARDRSTQKEQLGHVVGGYKTVFEQLSMLVKAAGGRIRTNTSVKKILPGNNGGLWIEHNDTKEYFDKVIFTSPVDVLQQVAGNELIRAERAGTGVEYLGVICMVLVTREPLVPYYVVNIADDRVPFTGIIGLSNLVDSAETAGLHVTFLPKYVHSDSAQLAATDDEVRALFFAGLDIMIPDWRARGLESVHINRAKRVQPLQVLNYSQLVPQVHSDHPDFYVLNTTQFTHMTLNNNEVIRAVDEFLAGPGNELNVPATSTAGPETQVVKAA